MPDTLATLAGRLTRLDRRVKALERASNDPYPPWRDLPLTGNAALADPRLPPQVRATPWDTLEFSGRIALFDQRATDQSVLALLPDGYRPAVPRTMPVASDASRGQLQIEVTAEGQLLLLVQNGGTTRVSWISLDGASCRLDASDDDD